MANLWNFVTMWETHKKSDSLGLRHSFAQLTIKQNDFSAANNLNKQYWFNIGEDEDANFVGFFVL